jgi:hypothetical protein
MSMLDEDEDYEDDVLYERRGTSVLGNARPELVVPTPWTSRRWTGAPNSRLLASSMRCDGEACLDEAEPRTRFAGRCLAFRPNATSYKSAGYSIVTARTNQPERPMGGTDESQ